VVTVDKAVRRTFLVPEYTPLILHVRTVEDRIEVLEAIPLVGASGRPVTGLSNLEGHDEPPYDATGTKRLAFNQSGLDTEGLVRTRSGRFWLADEYGPSLVHADARGKVLARYVPAGMRLPQADYPVFDTLPAIYARRKDNRGFESLALSADETALYAAVQSPLSNPDKATGDASRITRLLRFDVRSGKPSAEFAYRFELAKELDPKTPAQAADMKVSGLVVADEETLLVLERTDVVARVYAASLRGATDLLGSGWDDPARAPSLEACAEPEASGVRTLSKSLVVDLTALPGIPGKIEGIAILDGHTLAVANDNDFDVGTIDKAGDNVGKGVRCRLFVIEGARVGR
jgi:hypothetical protein